MTQQINYYNDYIRITKHYLRNLNAFRVTLENLRLEEDKLQKEMDAYEDIPSPTVAYQEKTAKSSSELTNVEAVIERRMVKEKQIRRIKEKTIRLDTLIHKVENALAVLPDADRRILQDYLIDGGTAESVAWTNYCSARTVRYKTNRMVRGIADMLFGPETVSANQDFVFAE